MLTSQAGLVLAPTQRRRACGGNDWFTCWWLLSLPRTHSGSTTFGHKHLLVLKKTPQLCFTCSQCSRKRLNLSMSSDALLTRFQRMSSCSKGTKQPSNAGKHRWSWREGGTPLLEGSTGWLEDVTSFGWGASWCLLPRRWWGTSCCTAWTASRPAPPETSQSSRPRRFCTPGSRWWTWGRSSGVRGHRWGWGAAPSERQTKGGHPSRSHPPSPRAGTLARSHSRDGRASGTAGFLHSCSSPVGRSLTVYECAAFHLVCECEDHDPHKLKACFWSHQSPIIR